MKVFLSYASEDKQNAEEIQLALVADEHQVFFDAQSLPPGGDYRLRIKEAVMQSDCMVFLISPDSIADESYAQTELGYARLKWPSPKQRVVPVIVRETEWATIPSYLKAVTILEPKGNLAAAVSTAVGGLGVIPKQGFTARARSRISRLLSWCSTPVGTVSACLISFVAGIATMAMIFEFFLLSPQPPCRVANADLLRSAAGTGATADLTFTNSLPESIELFWLDGAGKEVSFKDIAPSSTRSVSSYSGHPWLVKDASSQETLLLLLPRNQKTQAFSISVANKR